GDILIVGINSDSSIKRYKSEKRPIISQEERAEIVAAIGCVDFVTIFDEETPIELLKIIKPKAHVKGAEYKGKIPEKEIVEKNGGKVVFLERSDASTSSIISRILERYTGE
ncbi:MAG: hypothetical protein HGA85_08005, partial [Nanoarchaeota archaeon]|nr:hypothetical protein [Nanoarchaeota archaeon]